MLNSTQQHSARLSIDAQPAELPAPKSQKPPRNLDVSPLRTQVQLLRGEPIPCPRIGSKQLSTKVESFIVTC